jgi:hypothetical protein
MASKNTLARPRDRNEKSTAPAEKSPLVTPRALQKAFHLPNPQNELSANLSPSHLEKIGVESSMGAPRKGALITA